MHMESVVPARCQHVTILRNPLGLQRLYRAAESVFSACNRPVVGIGEESVPRCLHPECVHPAACDVYVCVQCVYTACLSSCDETESTSVQGSLDSQDESGMRSESCMTHLGAHVESSKHNIFLSVEHGHLFCYSCNDFVFDRFLDAAIANQSESAQLYRQNFISSTSPLSQPLGSGGGGGSPISKRRGKKKRSLTSNAWIPTDKEIELFANASFSLPSVKSGTTPPVGLYNLGNSCYMNSVLQAFLNAPPLRNFFLANEHKPYCTKDPKLECFACAIDQLVCDSCFVEEHGRKGSSTSFMEIPFLVPQLVLDIVWRNADHLATYTQHDAHEFLIAALNLLSRHCRLDIPLIANREQKNEPFVAEVSMKGVSSGNQTADPSGMMSPTNAVATLGADSGEPCAELKVLPCSSKLSIVQNLFSGTLQSDVVCRVCGNSSPTLEKFYDISLDVDKVIKPVPARRSRAHSPVIDVRLDGGSSVNKEAHQRDLWISADGEDCTWAKCTDRDPGDVPGISVNALGGSRTLSGAATGNRQYAVDIDMTNSLYECLSRFTEPELLGSSSKMHCASCSTKQEAMKQMSIRALPPVLCFHFKRFEQSFASIRRSEMVKINTAVEFPTDGLDLAPFLTSEVLRRRSKVDSAAEVNKSQSKFFSEVNKRLVRNGDVSHRSTSLTLRERQDSVYDLFAIVNHVGKIDSGHYTAMVRRGSVWFKCDDEKVTVMDDIGPVIRSEEAYLVFYVQRHPHIQH